MTLLRYGRCSSEGSPSAPPSDLVLSLPIPDGQTEATRFGPRSRAPYWSIDKAGCLLNPLQSAFEKRPSAREINTASAGRSSTTGGIHCFSIQTPAFLRGGPFGQVRDVVVMINTCVVATPQRGKRAKYIIFLSTF